MSDQFTLLGKPYCSNVFEDYEDVKSAKSSDLITSLLASIRHHHPKHTVALTTSGNVDLLQYAAGDDSASAELDTSEDGVIRARLYGFPASKDDAGYLADLTLFARYKYVWKEHKFILYIVETAFEVLEFVLFPPDGHETALSNSKTTDALFMTVGQAQHPYTLGIWVFEMFWNKSSRLLDQVRNISWDDVILDEKTKTAVTTTIEEFFDDKAKYKDLGVPWKRGIIFHGPPGNGKTFSLRALMHALIKREVPVNLLYVKEELTALNMSSVFDFARSHSPCLLIMEDIDSLVSQDAQSNFLNEVDGIGNNDGILMLATTSHLKKLDPGLKNRPSRFDRKYFFPNPEKEERELYSDFWRKKLSKGHNDIEFPKALNAKIADLTKGFSFAYLQEAFVSALLVLVRDTHFETAGKETDALDDHKYKLEDLPLYVEMEKQVKLLRDDIGSEALSQALESPRIIEETLGVPERRARDPKTARAQVGNHHLSSTGSGIAALQGTPPSSR